MTTGRLRRGIGVRFVMLAVVAVPLVGFLILAAGSIRSANVEVAAAQRAKVAGEELTDVTSLQAAVALEHYWAAATATIRALGLDPAVTARAMGVDVETRWLEARDLVDAKMAGRDDPQLADALEAARTALAAGDASLFRAADVQVSREVDGVRGALDDLALEVDDPRAMVASASALSAAVDLRIAVFDMVGALYSERYPSQAVTDEPVEDLAAARSRYTAAVGALLRTTGTWPEMGAALDTFRTEQGTRSFLADVDGVLADDGLSPEQEANSLGDEAVAFNDTMDMIDRADDVVELASSGLARTGERLTDRSETTRRNTVLAVLLVGSVTVAVAVAIGRWMVASLDGISSSARAMNEGELDHPAPIRGPSEVRVAAEALNGAAANIRSAERQVLALANGDLSEPDGPTHVAGRLGDSLHAAFDRLAESMKDRERLRSDLQKEANHDGLTGLPNRSAIMRALSAAVESAASVSGQVAVLFVDVDDFKVINDQHGHGVGDEVLKGIADRVRQAARSGDFVGRLGGDELVVIAHPVDGDADALSLARRIRRTVSRPLPTAAALTPSLSIGVATGSGQETTPERLLHDADLAVYEAKGAGGDKIEICTAELRDASHHRQAVERSLTRAIASDELAVDLQAVVRAGDGAVVGAEALVRWPQADGTMRPPVDFVPIAERSNLIVDLDRWVITKTVEVLARWSRHPATASLSAAVNISARHASVSAFSDHILETLDRHAVPPSRLVVELTESALIANLDHVVGELRRLQLRGVTVAIDDFGTGYTSLALLHQLPIDILKLDRALTTNLAVDRIRAVVQLVVDTAHVIGLSVTAEGVETTTQLAELRELGVDAFQGFLLHRPCPTELFPSVLDTRGGLLGLASRAADVATRTAPSQG